MRQSAGWGPLTIRCRQTCCRPRRVGGRVRRAWQGTVCGTPPVAGPAGRTLRCGRVRRLRTVVASATEIVPARRRPLPSVPPVVGTTLTTTEGVATAGAWMGDADGSGAGARRLWKPVALPLPLVGRHRRPPPSAARGCVCAAAEDLQHGVCRRRLPGWVPPLPPRHPALRLAWPRTPVGGFGCLSSSQHPTALLGLSTILATTPASALPRVPGGGGAPARGGTRPHRVLAA